MTDFNLLNHPILFATPERLTPFSFWHEHIPFALLLVDLLKPRLIVELGSYYGDSYCAFCQAVSELKTGTKCYAVDNWSGDIHVGTYGSEVLEDLRSHHDPRYAEFSTLLQSDFDEATSYFKDGSIDLLHIDGTHTYEAVQHDFNTWLPKMCARGVVILHDTNVREGVFGVRTYFEEIKSQYPNFEFFHCYGLGVLATGSEPPGALRWLFDATPDERDSIRALFHRLGQLLSTQARERELIRRTEEQVSLTEERNSLIEEQNSLIGEQNSLIKEKDQLISVFRTKLAKAESGGQKLRIQLAQAQKVAQELNDQIYQLSSGIGWRILEKTWKVKTAVGAFVHTSLPGKVTSIVKKTPSNKSPSLLFNVDSIKINRRGSFFAEGWVFHCQDTINKLTLIVKTASGETRFDCKYGFPRNDVRKEYKLPNSLYSGFSAIGDLVNRDITGLSLEMSYPEGKIESADFPLERVHYLESEVMGSDETTIGEMFRSLYQPGATNLRFAAVSTSPSWGKLSIQDREFVIGLVNPSSPNRRFSLIFDHNVGGGANYYRAGVVERLINRGDEVLLAYYDLTRLEYRIEHISSNWSAHIYTDSIENLVGIASLIKVGEIFINNLYTYKAPLDVLASILRVKKVSKARLIMTAHDFMCICPEISLVDKDGKFCGIPPTGVCSKCLPENMSEILKYVSFRGIDEWRAAWGEFLGEADQVLCFSNSTISLIKKAYPDLDPNKFICQPHLVNYLPDHKPTVDLNSDMHIGIVGNITRNKGARVVEQMAKIIFENNLPIKITVIGTILREEDTPGISVTGNFRHEDLPYLIERCGINLCLLPSICPETFSYVTEELMLLGMPLAVFNIGAPAERVSHYAKGLVLDNVGDAPAALDQLIAFHTKLRNGQLPG